MRIKPKLYDLILQEAHRLYTAHQYKVKGQTVEIEDGLDYWIANVAWHWSRDEED